MGKMHVAPEVNVKNHDECVAYGRALNRPVTCVGIGLDVDAATKAMLKDPVTYTLQCYRTMATADDSSKAHLRAILSASRPEYTNKTLQGLIDDPQRPDRGCYAGFIYSDSHN